MQWKYSLSKDSNAELGVIIEIGQNWPTNKAVSTKISMILLLQFCYHFDISERKGGVIFAILNI